MSLMTCTVALGVAASFLATGAAGHPGHDHAEPTAGGSDKNPAYVLGYTMTGIDGEEVELARFEGKVLMIVNTASRCGLTPQYEALQAMQDEHGDDGLVVLGFPANNFGGQEPGTDEQIAAFCTERFDVTFPMFSKVSVKGDDAHPLFVQLAELPEPLGGEPGWNFTKFIVDRSGVVVARFEPRTRPDSDEVKAVLAGLLEADG